MDTGKPAPQTRGRAEANGCSVATTWPQSPEPPTKNGRTVKKVLADGTVRTYQYAPHASRSKATSSDPGQHPPPRDARAKGQHLYLIQANHGGPIKIGRSRSPRRRLQTLQTGSGAKLKLRAVLKNKGESEPVIHARLKQFRLAGEWFKWTDESQAIVIDYFGPLKTIPDPPEPANLAVQRFVEEMARKYDGRKAREAERKLARETMRAARQARAHETKGFTFNQWLAWQSGETY